MNRYIIILIIVLLVVAAALVGIGFALRPAPQTPSQNPGDTTPPSTGTNPVSSTVDVTAQTAEAVKSAFQSKIPSDNPDHTKLYATAVSGQYALQSWSGDIMGGQGLLKYDDTRRQWELLDAGGGMWTVSSLVAEGVPTSTAQDLLSQFGR